jgi:hypothetical protein
MPLMPAMPSRLAPDCTAKRLRWQPGAASLKTAEIEQMRDERERG